VIVRSRKDETQRYTGMYRGLSGRPRSAGTFATDSEALKVATIAEAAAAAGRGPTRDGPDRHCATTWRASGCRTTPSDEGKRLSRTGASNPPLGKAATTRGAVQCLAASTRATSPEHFLAASTGPSVPTGLVSRYQRIPAGTTPRVALTVTTAVDGAARVGVADHTVAYRRTCRLREKGTPWARAIRSPLGRSLR